MSDAFFDPDRTGHYHLTLRISPERFTFALYDAEGNPPFYHADYPTDSRHSLPVNLKTLSQDNPFMGHTYRSTHILIAGLPCVAVPKELFDDGQAEALYYGCMPKKDYRTVLCHPLPQDAPVLLYAPDRMLCQLLSERFPDANIQAAAVPVMEYLLTRSRIGTSRKMYVHCHERQMDVYAYEAGRFLLNNSFRCTQGNDLLYYALYIWQQLGFDQKKDELYLIGKHIPDRDSTLKELQRFVAQVAVIHPAAEFKRTEYAKADIDFEIQASFHIQA